VALALAMLAPMASAAPVPSQTTCATPAAGDKQAVTAERDLIKGRLMDFGLTDKDAASRVALLSDAEVHAIAADLDALQAAGATSTQQWDTVTVLLLLILVAIIAS
jgi:hypothetical protein